MSPEFTQLETFRTPEGNGATTLIVTEIAGLEEHCIALTVAIDLVEEAATVAALDDLGDEITGVAADPERDSFYQSTLKGCFDARKLSTGEHIKSVEPVPNIMLVGADFRDARFDTDTLKDMIRTSGAIVD